MRKIVRTIDDYATVTCFGSFKSGVALYNSDVDIGIEGITGERRMPTISAVAPMSRRCSRIGDAMQKTCDERARHFAKETSTISPPHPARAPIGCREPETFSPADILRARQGAMVRFLSLVFCATGIRSSFSHSSPARAQGRRNRVQSEGRGAPRCLPRQALGCLRRRLSAGQWGRRRGHNESEAPASRIAPSQPNLSG